MNKQGQSEGGGRVWDYESGEKRHPASQRFHDLLREAGELHNKKQGDYGRATDPFANIRASQEWGLKPWVGAMVRATDKLRRLQAFALKGSLNNESAYDSLMDLAVYALIGYVLLEEDEAQQHDASSEYREV